eukprot:1378586-Karenia_brevis.AAC.1
MAAARQAAASSPTSAGSVALTEVARCMARGLGQACDDISKAAMETQNAFTAVPPCHVRKLSPRWAEAVASEQKFAEFV